MSASIRQDRPSLSGNVIPAAHVQVVHAHANTVGEVSCALGTTAAPRITLIKDGDVVRAIEIVCTCGEVIRLDCAY
jgi:hypothetical protein